MEVWSLAKAGPDLKPLGINGKIPLDFNGHCLWSLKQSEDFPNRAHPALGLVVLFPISFSSHSVPLCNPYIYWVWGTVPDHLQREREEFALQPEPQATLLVAQAVDAHS